MTTIKSKYKHEQIVRFKENLSEAFCISEVRIGSFRNLRSLTATSPRSFPSSWRGKRTTFETA